MPPRLGFAAPILLRKGKITKSVNARWHQNKKNMENLMSASEPPRPQGGVCPHARRFAKKWRVEPSCSELGPVLLAIYHDSMHFRMQKPHFEPDPSGAGMATSP
jgi:hypothetical protein